MRLRVAAIGSRASTSAPQLACKRAATLPVIAATMDATAGSAAGGEQVRNRGKRAIA
jgi:hypothetical protein